MTIVWALLGIAVELLVTWALIKIGEKDDDKVEDP